MKNRRRRRNPKEKVRDLPPSKIEQEGYDGPVVFPTPEEWDRRRGRGLRELKSLKEEKE